MAPPFDTLTASQRVFFNSLGDGGGSDSLQKLFGGPSIITPTQADSSGSILTPSQAIFKSALEQNEEETGLFNSIANTFSIPQQTLLTVGKNIGESIRGKELSDKNFIEELKLAADGKGKLSFHDVLKSVGAEAIDLSLPEGFRIESPWVRIPAAIAIGILAGAAIPLTGGASIGLGLGAFAGLTAGFASESFLSGRKGIVSSVADVALDPLNKLRLFQPTRQLDKAEQSKSILRQVVEGDRRLFDFKGTAGFGKKVDRISEFMLTPVDLLQDHAAKLVNATIGQPILKAVDPVTGYVHRHVTSTMNRLFKDNGDIVEAVRDATKDTKKAEQAGENITKAKQEANTAISIGGNKIEELLSRKTITERKSTVGELERTAGGAAPEELGLVDLTPEKINQTLGDAPTFFKRELQLPEDKPVFAATQERLRELGSKIDPIKEEILQIRRNRTAVGNLLKGSPKNPEALQKQFDQFTNEIKDKQDQIDSLIPRLKRLEKQIPKAPAISRGVSTAEVRVMRKLLENVFNEDQLNRLEIFFEQSGGARDLIGGSEEAITATLLTKMANAGVGESSRMMLRIHRSASNQDAFNLITGVIYDNMSTLDKDKLLGIAKRSKDNLEAGELKKWFQENMYKAGIHAVKKDDLAQAGFLARMIDGIRMYWRKMIATLTKSDFDNPKVYDWLSNFSKNINHFDNIQKTGLADFATFDKARNRGEFHELLTNVWAKMEGAGMLPEGSAYNVARNGAIWLPLIKSEKDAAMKLRRAIFEPGIVSNTTISPHRSIGTISLQNVKEEIVRQKDFILKNHVLSEKEYGELTKIIDRPKANLNDLVKPGTVASELYEKLQRHMDLIPLEHFKMDEAILRWHVVQSHRNITARQIVDTARQIGVRSQNAVNQLKRSILNNIDRVWLDPEQNARASIILKNNESRIKTKEGLASLNQVNKLLNKQVLRVKDYARIATELENIYPFLNPSDVPKLRTFLPNAKDFDQGFFVAGRGDGLDSEGAFLSPELARLGMAAKVFQIEKVIDPKTLEVKGVKATLKKNTKLDKFFKAGDNFEDIFNTQIFKELEEKGRGKTLGRDELPIRKEFLEGSKVLPQNEIDKLVESGEWVEFKGLSKKGRIKGQLPPAIQGLVGTYVPKEIHKVLVSSEIDLPRAWRAAALAFGNAVRGIDEQEAIKRTNKRAEVLERVTGIKASEGLKDLAQRFSQGLNFDYLTLLFKSQALLGPAFHTRNLVSGMVTNLMHGVEGGQMAGAFKDLYNSHVFGRKTKELDEFLSKGLVGGGIRGELLEETGGGLLAGQQISLNPLSAQNFAGYRFNFKLGGYIEDLLRYSAFKHARQSMNLNVEEASNFVKALHFDYNDLSAFERKVMKRLIPFYTYWRKAIVRDSRMFMERTGNFFKLSHVIQEIESGVEPEDSEAVAFWVRQRMGVPFRRNPDTGAMEYFLLSSFIPAAELVEKVAGPTQGQESHILPKPIQNIAESFLQQANPILKQPIQQITNWDFYFGKPISEYPGEEADFFGLSIPTRAVPLLRSIRFLNDLERGTTSLLQLPNSSNPDLPRPSPAQGLFNVLSGGRIVPNDNPERNIFFNVVRPTQDLEQRLRSSIRRTGFESSNSQSLLNLFRQAQERQARVLNNFTPPRPRQPAEAAADDPLRRLFNTRNPNNFLTQ